MTFKERGYVTEFGYGAFKHKTRNEMLIIDTDVFGPCCSPDLAGGRHFTLTTPDGAAYPCYNIWDALAAWLGYALGYAVMTDNDGIEDATREFIAKAFGNEQAVLDIVRFITVNYLNTKCAWGHKPVEDLVETGDARLVVDLDCRAENPYWGTVQDQTGNPVGRNMFGEILMRIRNGTEPGYTTIVPACRGCTIS